MRSKQTTALSGHLGTGARNAALARVVSGMVDEMSQWPLESVEAAAAITSRVTTELSDIEATPLAVAAAYIEAARQVRGALDKG